MEINKTYGFLNGKWIRWYAEGLKQEEGEYSKELKWYMVGTIRWTDFRRN